MRVWAAGLLVAISIAGCSRDSETQSGPAGIAGMREQRSTRDIRFECSDPRVIRKSSQCQAADLPRAALVAGATVAALSKPGIMARSAIAADVPAQELTWGSSYYTSTRRIEIAPPGGYYPEPTTGELSDSLLPIRFNLSGFAYSPDALRYWDRTGQAELLKPPSVAFDNASWVSADVSNPYELIFDFSQSLRAFGFELTGLGANQSAWLPGTVVVSYLRGDSVVFQRTVSGYSDEVILVATSISGVTFDKVRLNGDESTPHEGTEPDNQPNSHTRVFRDFVDSLGISMIEAAVWGVLPSPNDIIAEIDSRARAHSSFAIDSTGRNPLSLPCDLRLAPNP